MKKAFYGLGIIVLLILGGFFLGPQPEFEQVNWVPDPTQFDIREIDAYLAKKESEIEHLKVDNHARIIWADSSRKKTEYSIVYIHGFTASQGEGYPMHLNIADSIGANLFLARLPEHGVSNLDAMKTLTPQALVESAKEAIAVGKSIGKKVLVMSCSTGGTLSIYLAAGDPSLAGLILLSPNIALRSKAASLVTGPWGKQLAYQIIGEHRDMRTFQKVPEYWTNHHHTNGLIALQNLMNQTMTDDVFSRISMPVYCGYFYKNEDIQDPVVSVEAMLDFKSTIKTAEDDMEFEAFETGDHVLGSIYKNEGWKDVQNEVLDFIHREIIN